MKIALVHTALWGRGGAERQLLNLAVELQKTGNEVEIFTTEVNGENCYPELLKQVTVNVLSNNFTQSKRDNNHIASAATYRGASKNIRNQFQKILSNQLNTSGLPAMLRLGKTIPKGFDVINNHNPPTEWAAFTAKRRLKVPVVWMCNEPPSWYLLGKTSLRKKVNWPLFEVWDKISVRYIDAITVLSNVAGGMVRQTYDKPYTIVRTGLDIEKFYNVSGKRFRKEHGLEKDFLLLQVANLSFKRQADSIKALYCLSKNHSNVKLILDGAGSQTELKRLAQRLGLNDRVIFWHAPCDKDLVEVYAACDVFLFPQQITWGLAVVEAMASAKPVIVSKGCGVAEIIQDNVNGFLVENGMPKEIAKKVESLMSDPDLSRKIGEQAFAYVKENLSWKNYAQQMEIIFEKTVKNYQNNDNKNR